MSNETIIPEDVINNIIIDYKNGFSVEKLSKKYENYSPHIIRTNLKRCGTYNTNKVSESEVKLWIQDYNNHMILNDIAIKYNRPPETIRRKLKESGVYQTHTYSTYTDEEVDIIKKYYPSGDWRILLEKLPNRDRQSIYTKASKLGIEMDKFMWDEESVNKKLAERGFILKSPFTNIRDKHFLMDNQGYLYFTILSEILHTSSIPDKFTVYNKYTIENIKNYIKIHNINCILLSDKYINNHEKLKWKCKCGKDFLCSWGDFFQGKHFCNDCAKEISIRKNSYSIDEVKKMLADTEYTVIESDFKKASIGFPAVDNNGYKVIVTREVLHKGAKAEIFHVSNPYTIENIRLYIKNNCISTQLLSDKYIGNSSKMRWRCSCGCEFERCWNNFLQGAYFCKKCANDIKQKQHRDKEFELVKQYFINKGYELLSTEYINGNEKLAYICPKHRDKGIQYISWSHCKHRNQGCPYCAREKVSINQRIPENELKYLTESKGFIYDHVEYLNGKHHNTYIFFLCPNHLEKGIQFKCLADMRKSTGLCNYCLGKTRSHEDFIARMFEINPDIEIISEYKNTSNDIKCRCKIDGNEWISNANRLLGGAGCPQCAIRINSEKRKKSDEEFKEEIEEKFQGKIIILSEYTGSHDNVTCKCTIDDTVWETTATSLLTNSVGCPTCISNATRERCVKSHEDFLDELSTVNPDIIPLEKYYNINTKIKCLCKKHNHIWYASPAKLLHRRTGCPKCASYHNENVLDSILDKWGYKYSIQKKYVDCIDIKMLPFDRYLDDFNVLIEYDGEGHFKPIRRGNMSEEEAIEKFKLVQKHDKIKNEYCKRNNIPLIRIPYWEKDDMEYFLFNEFVKYNVIELVS